MKLNASEAKSRGLKANDIVVLQHHAHGVSLRIHGKVVVSDSTPSGCLELDQKLRMALALSKQGDTLELSGSDRREHEWYRDRIGRFMGVQRNIARARMANYLDMEVGICRLPEEFLQTIGAVSGDVVVLETPKPSGKGFNRVSIRAFNITDAYGDGKKYLPISYQTKHRDLWYNISRDHEVDDADLPMVAIDLATREKLGIEPESPVYVHRSLRHAVSKQLYRLSTPLVLACLGALVSLDAIKESGYRSLGLLATAMFIVCVLHLSAVRQKAS